MDEILKVMPLETKPREFSIYSQVSLGCKLIDHRHRTRGMYMGTPRSLVRQLGIQVEELENCYKFTATKMRLQKFVEKLHFGNIKYSKTPF